MAIVPYTYECSKDAGFVMDPNEQKRVGYVTALKGFKLDTALATDLKVSVPHSSQPTFPGLKYADASGDYAKVVGVMESFEWNGGVGDPIKIAFYVSKKNMNMLQGRDPTALVVNKLAWWITDYDQETKQWFEQAYPKDGAVSGTIAGGKANPEIDIDLTPVPAKDGIDLNVYKVTLRVVPPASTSYQLHFASSSEKRVIKAWGAVVGLPSPSP